MANKLHEPSTFIKNNQLEWLYSADLNGSELKVALCLLRKLNGFHKTSDLISKSQIVSATGLSGRAVGYAINKLEKLRFIDVERHRSEKGSNLPNRITLNQNIDEWGGAQSCTIARACIGAESCGGMGQNHVNRMVQEPAPTKERITKETYTKETVPSSMRSFNPVTMIWTIENAYYDQIKQLYEQWFGVPNHDLFEK